MEPILYKKIKLIHAKVLKCIGSSFSQLATGRVSRSWRTVPSIFSMLQDCMKSSYSPLLHSQRNFNKNRKSKILEVIAGGSFVN